MVRAGTGITFMPEIAINEPETGIRYIPFTEPVPKRTIGLVWRKTSVRTELMEQLIEHISVAVDHAQK
jgi:LysR family hydrogen peroxide-inducible transcriptional activator